ncbi:hypothetical protein ANO11243_013490 [Dothideomycetidae sp. 11243]|nr:hypothetical protein ANO11243_013490 [fungal sp. No.11243]
MPLPPIPPASRRSRLPGASELHKSAAFTPRREGSGSMLSTQSARKVTPSSIARLKTPPAAALPAPIITTTPADDDQDSTTAATSPSSPTSPSAPHRETSRRRRSARRTVSIGSFPQPPRGVFSLPSSAESTPTLLSTINSPAQSPLLQQTHASGVSPSIRNSGFGDDREKATHAGLARTSSDGNKVRASMIPATTAAHPSAPDRRPSSAHGSTATDRTQFEDIDPAPHSGLTLKSHSKMPPVDTSSTRSLRSTKSSSNMKDNKGNVVVSVRVRPNGGINTSEDWTVDSRGSSISYKGGEGGDLKYDNVFSPSDDNERVYDATAKRMVRRVMEGYHGTVFAYGITGTGKTFSMQGTAHSPGIMPLAITDIFSYIREHPDREFLLRVSYLEIYNEKIYDLLSSTQSGAQQEDIKLREDSKRGVYATPLKEEIVQSPTQLLRVIARGDLARRTASTQFNARSSRSHAVVQIVVESRERTSKSSGRELPGGVLISTLSLIDLAGSERAAEDKERRTEGSHINKSLLTLGTVISRLASDKPGKSDAGADKDRKHLPYRDSKLTRLLQSALSGNALVSILCTVQLCPMGNWAGSNALAAPAETLNTLNFASRAKNNIVSHAKRNESHPAHGADARALLDRYRTEIEELKRQLVEQTHIKPEPIRTEEEEERWLERERESAERHEGQMLEMQLARTALKERIGHLNRLILSSKSAGVNSGTKGIRDKLAPAPDEVGVALGSPEINSRVSSTISEDIDAVVLARPGMKRVVSFGSVVLSEEDEDDEVASGDSGEASPRRQVFALQADLADKNRYIATLERRLLEARRVNQSRTRKSTASQQSDSSEDIVAERDREIAELRSRLDDQSKMVHALRNSARRRGLVDIRSASAGHLPGTGPGLSIDTALASDQSRTAVRRTQSGGVSFGSQPNLAHTGNRSVNFSRVTPKAMLSPSRDGPPDSGKSLGSSKSMTDMTQALDQMLAVQRRVSGEGENGGGMKFGTSVTVHEMAPPRPLMVGGMI